MPEPDSRRTAPPVSGPEERPFEAAPWVDDACWQHRTSFERIRNGFLPPDPNGRRRKILWLTFQRILSHGCLGIRQPFGSKKPAGVVDWNWVEAHLRADFSAALRHHPEVLRLSLALERWQTRDDQRLLDHERAQWLALVDRLESELLPSAEPHPTEGE